jgi:hypothetical protein
MVLRATSWLIFFTEAVPKPPDTDKKGEGNLVRGKPDKIVVEETITRRPSP